MTADGWTIAGVLGAALVVLGIVAFVVLFVFTAALHGLDAHDRARGRENDSPGARAAREQRRRTRYRPR